MTKPKVYKPIRVISWGMGVQSTTLCVMSALGDIPPVDYIFSADTQWEKQKTYVMRDWYIRWLQEHGQAVEIVTAGNIRERSDHGDLPLWCNTGAPLRRQCTSNYKILPIRRRIREILNLPIRGGRVHPGRVKMLLGISLDEYQRMKDSTADYIENQFPLIDLGMSRQDCMDYLLRHDLPVPPKSACVGCPFSGAARWLELKTMYPEEWQEAVAFDRQVRTPPERMIERGYDTKLYLWQKLKPLEEEDFETLAVGDQADENDICDSGYCWV